VNPERLQSEKNSRIVCALLYLAGRVKSTEMLRLLRFLYLADKHHFIRHGTTITGDSYVALGIGPAGVGAMIISNAWTLCVGMFDKARIPAMFSLTEKDSMDRVVDEFTGLGDGELEGYMLALPEWKASRRIFNVKAPGAEPPQALGPDGQLFYPIGPEHLALRSAGDTFFTTGEALEETHKQTGGKHGG